MIIVITTILELTAFEHGVIFYSGTLPRFLQSHPRGRSH